MVPPLVTLVDRRLEGLSPLWSMALPLGQGEVKKELFGNSVPKMLWVSSKVRISDWAAPLARSSKVIVGI